MQYIITDSELNRIKTALTKMITLEDMIIIKNDLQILQSDLLTGGHADATRTKKIYERMTRSIDHIGDSTTENKQIIREILNI